MKKTIFLLLITLLLASCTKKIDGTSEEAMKESIEKVKSSLDDKDKKEFEEALQIIMLNGVDFSNLLSENGVKETVGDIRNKLNGMTASDVIKEGERIKVEIELKKKQQAKDEIIELYAKKEKAEQAKHELDKFKVKRSRFYKRKQGTYFITEEPIIELTVFNGTEHAVSRAYFTGILSSPNRSVPWLKDDFNYQIAGGLEPGEEVTWRLAPNSFGEWGTVDAPKDAILIVEVKKLDGADGETLFSVDDFDEYDKDRLEELLKAYPEFKK
ncbi:DUF6694 family lipoprotein [Mangrovibacterium marinum]|uniref:Lipoprotein n=1 Tax=Mangrovibacterium marinum TaxID=1639118 RepID=A0A2T5C4D5_9BACT|nr:DUF6694 family lipoprotein [Mangrovibacterium marinum]PTN09717.1 hypothetical protein C8N47_1031 [Mangrovibacterium marinum]